MLRGEIGAVFKEAIRLHETGAVARAEQIYREVLAADADAADAWNMLAVALCQQNQRRRCGPTPLSPVRKAPVPPQQPVQCEKPASPSARAGRPWRSATCRR